MKLRASAAVTSYSMKNIIWIGSLHVLAAVLCWQYFSWTAFAVFVFAHYLAGMFGITFGFHRLLTHKAFVVPRWVENTAALCGTLACQGGPISWVATHRIHHAYSDHHEDPHDATKGFWYSHFIWIFKRRQDLDQFEEFKHYAPDLASRPFFRFLENYMIPIQIVWGLGTGVLAGVLGAQGAGFNWHLAIGVVSWGTFLRLCTGYHVTWFVNSAAHKWGTNPNNLKDLSKNNWWVAILAFGEGWHNNHHAQPRAARHGWRWWQFDQTWILIKTLKAFGLVGNVKLPQNYVVGRRARDEFSPVPEVAPSVPNR